MYKIEIEEVNLSFSKITNDKEFWKDISEYEKAKVGNYCRFRLISQVDSAHLALNNLLENGLNAPPQGPMKPNDQLISYIENHFNDYYSEDFFNDLPSDLSKDIFEGIQTTVTVNKYERSSIARKKCIEYHGIACKICGINFEKFYGEIGKDFIHVHHIIPLNEIGKEYKVNYKKDLIPVCPNCHAMLHKKVNNQHLSIKELQNIVK